MLSLRLLLLAGVTALVGCATHGSSASSPPDIGISVTKVDAATNTATIVVINHSRRRVLILTNMLVWSSEADVRDVGRPNYDFGDDMVAMSHDARLEAGDSLKYMDVRLKSIDRHAFPAIYACWDNPRWSCERYWRIPSKLRWEALVEARAGNSS